MIKQYHSYEDVPDEAKGLDYLLTHCKNTPKKISDVAKLTYLSKHPFNLEIDTTLHIKYIGHPGVTESSVKGFITSIANAIIQSPYLHQIRIIKVEEIVNNKTVHDIFYEIRIDNRIFMCGGCNDYSGTAKSGKKRIEIIISTLSKIFNIDAEEVIIPYDKERKLVKNLEDDISKYHE